MEKHTENTFYEWVKNRYEYDELRDIAEHGCVSGCASGLIYYHETMAIYDQYADELHTKLGEWIDEMDLVPEFITKELGYEQGFKNAMVWFVAEQYASEIYQTIESEEV